MSAPLTRIVLRYFAMYVALKGILPEDLATAVAQDEDILMFVNIGMGAVIGGANEFWYWLAKKYGWNT